MTYKLGKEQAYYADKLLVRDYINEKGYEDYLPLVFGSWKTVDEVDCNRLPERFVLKTNHGCGGDLYSICLDKNKFDWVEEKNKLKKALKTNYAKSACEYHYKFIEPILFAEEYLEDKINPDLMDYKIHCFNGKPHCILVCSNRKECLKLDWFDTNWEDIGYGYDKYASPHKLEKPFGLDKMLMISSELSKGFPFVRIDFYSINNKVYIGEMTFTPAGGSLFYLNDKGQHIMGELVDLDLA